VQLPVVVWRHAASTARGAGGAQLHVQLSAVIWWRGVAVIRSRRCYY